LDSTMTSTTSKSSIKPPPVIVEEAVDDEKPEVPETAAAASEGAAVAEANGVNGTTEDINGVTESLESTVLTDHVDQPTEIIPELKNEHEHNGDETDLDKNDEKRMNDHQNEEVNEPICYEKTISETTKAEIISEPALAAPALALAKPMLVTSVDETIKDTTEDLEEDQAPLASMESDPAPLASLDSITNSDLQSM